jgi:hypothetical protein
MCGEQAFGTFLSVLYSSRELPFHVARKKIAYIDDNGQLQKPLQPNGVKMEQFVFDVFAYSRCVCVIGCSMCAVIFICGKCCARTSLLR